ncbi:MAG: carbohydrate ABC transporter permease [Clostridia bacterium]|nr:carbohydrate ABC transporter permease [Clostridia bacterium]
MKSTLSKRKGREGLLIHIFFVIFTLSFVVPFLFVISISFSNEELMNSYGYKLIPMQVDFTAYKYVFNNMQQIIDSYKVTAFTSILGTFAGLLIMSMVAYPIAMNSFRYKKPITFFIFFTMIFGGGLIPSYILITQYLGLKDSVWVYIFPSLANAWNIMVLKTFFKGIPISCIESSRIDGASEFRIFLQIILPLSKPALASIGLLTLLSRWNDWYTCLIYIESKNLFSLQFLLQKILMDAEFVNNMSRNLPGGMIDLQNLVKIPTESMRFAMCIIAAGPMLVIFPFFQKYFTRGLTIGSVKG